MSRAFGEQFLNLCQRPVIFNSLSKMHCKSSERTWIKPLSSPATRSIPSTLIHPECATFLNLDMVFVTFLVLGAYICTRVAAVTANRCGFEGEKCTDVTGAYSFTKTGCLNCRQYLDSGLRFTTGFGCFLMTIGWYSMVSVLTYGSGYWQRYFNFEICRVSETRFGSRKFGYHRYNRLMMIMKVL